MCRRRRLDHADPVPVERPGTCDKPAGGRRRRHVAQEPRLQHAERFRAHGTLLTLAKPATPPNWAPRPARSHVAVARTACVPCGRPRAANRRASGNWRLNLYYSNVAAPAVRDTRNTHVPLPMLANTRADQAIARSRGARCAVRVRQRTCVIGKDSPGCSRCSRLCPL